MMLKDWLVVIMGFVFFYIALMLIASFGRYIKREVEYAEWRKGKDI